MREARVGGGAGEDGGDFGDGVGFEMEDGIVGVGRGFDAKDVVDELARVLEFRDLLRGLEGGFDGEGEADVAVGVHNADATDVEAAGGAERIEAERTEGGGREGEADGLEGRCVDGGGGVVDVAAVLFADAVTDVPEKLGAGARGGGDVEFEGERARRGGKRCIRVTDAVADEAAVSDRSETEREDGEEGHRGDGFSPRLGGAESEEHGEQDDPQHHREVAGGEEAALQVALVHAFGNGEEAQIDVGPAAGGAGNHFPAVGGGLDRERAVEGRETVLGEAAELFAAAIEEAKIGDAKFAVGGVDGIEAKFAEGGVGERKSVGERHLARTDGPADFFEFVDAATGVEEDLGVAGGVGGAGDLEIAEAGGRVVERIPLERDLLREEEGGERDDRGEEDPRPGEAEEVGGRPWSLVALLIRRLHAGRASVV